MSKRAIYLGGKRGSGAAGPSSVTWGPTDATDDWHLVGNDALASDTVYTANPSAASATIGASMGDIFPISHTYAMMWTLPSPIVAATTIESASLTIKTHSSGVSSGVLFWVSHDSTRASTLHPTGASTAVNRSNRDGGTTPPTAPVYWDEVTDALVTDPASGLAGIAADTSYTINVKNQIERIIARSGWDAALRVMTLFLSGAVENDFMGSWQAVGSDSSKIKTVADSADEPSLTIVYSN